MTKSEIRQEARKLMKGLWGTCIPIWFVYYLILWAANWFVSLILAYLGFESQLPLNSGGYNEFYFKIISKLPSQISMLVIGGPLLYSLIRIFLRIYNKELIGLGQLFEGFKDFNRTFGAYFLISLYTILWSFLLVIPGIIAALSYSMTFFVLAENPNIPISDAIRQSKHMMMGHKKDLFMLFISFFGWFTLSLLTFGIGFLWLSSYVKASYVIFYQRIKGDKVEGFDSEAAPVLSTENRTKMNYKILFGAIIVILFIVVIAVHPWKRVKLNSDIGQNLEATEFTPKGFMMSFFGNYLPEIDVSALNAKLVNNDTSSEWIIAEGQMQQLSGWNEIGQSKRDELLSLTGKIPYKFLKQWRLPGNSFFVAFEAGNWPTNCDSWGGSGFELSHDMGVAYYTKVEDGWQCASYVLNLGKFGAYCTTKLADDLIQISDTSYAIQTLSFDSSIIGLENSKPDVLLKIPCYGGIGHGDTEQFSSVVTVSPSSTEKYDIIVKSQGMNDETNETLKYIRRYTWNQGNYKYELTENEGNIEAINRSLEGN